MFGWDAVVGSVGVVSWESGGFRDAGMTWAKGIREGSGDRDEWDGRARIEATESGDKGGRGQ